MKKSAATNLMKNTEKKAQEWRRKDTEKNIVVELWLERRQQGGAVFNEPIR